MASTWWNFNFSQSTSQQTPSTEPHSNFPQIFRRPAKIVKPTSRNQSPRNSSRRRMTTQLPTRTRSVAGPSKIQRNSQRFPSQHYPARPTSWHPVSIDSINAHDYQQFHYTASDLNDPSFQPVFSTTSVNGLFTPMSYPITDEPLIHELVTPLDELSAHDIDSNYFSHQQEGSHFYPNASLKHETYVFDNSMSSNTANQFYWNNQYFQPATVLTAPASPEFLALPDVGEPFDVACYEANEPKDELVGMGLYDSPAQVQTASLLFGSFSGSGQRKSLKLEESFEPEPPSESCDDEQDQSDAEAESDPSQDELLDDAESEPVYINDVPIVEGSYEHDNRLSMVNGIQNYLGGQYPVATNTYSGWI